MQIKECLAHPSNYGEREAKKKYIVFHYTGNINDTALANCKYYQRPSLGASAHYFVDDNNIYCSVPPKFNAWSVGIGNRKEPYIRQPMYKVITNNNSISIEMCGSKTSRIASTKTVQNAINLCKYLMVKYNIPFNNVYRHWDVTGKECPAWLVDNQEWSKFKSLILEDNEMSYDIFKEYMNKYLTELSEEPGGTWSQQYRKEIAEKQLIENNRPKSFVTREELTTVIWRILSMK